MLPVLQLESEITAALRSASRLILEAPTGSGKSTQLPQILLRNGFLDNGQLIILQPRRLAARLLAHRVAQELGEKPGRTVGYRIRFEDVTGSKTKIIFVTEAILLRMMLKDASLHGISGLVFDEFHERHIHSDVSLALARQLQDTRRADLKLTVMSATLNTASVSSFLPDAAVLRSEGRQFPVQIQYTQKRPDFERQPVWEFAAQEMEPLLPACAANREAPHVLVFMPGSYEIQRTIQALQHLRAAKDFLIVPLYGELPPAQQDLAVQPSSQPRIIVATNVAETSITIDGIGLVVDGGLARVASYDPRRGINTLLVQAISRASADQRAGRAGRTAPGRAFRLWRISDQENRPAAELPEIKRIDLSETVLTLKGAGILDLKAFPWFETPEPAALQRALQLLIDLDALETPDGPLTETGRRLLGFPVHPRYARMLLEAEKHACVRAVALVAALAQGRNLLLRNVHKSVQKSREDILGESHDSDFFLLMRAWKFADAKNYDLHACQGLGIHAGAAREASRTLEQFLRLAEQNGLKLDEGQAKPEAIQRCILAGFGDSVAQRLDKGSARCRLLHGRRAVLGRDSVVREAPLLVAAEITEIGRMQGEIETSLGLCTAIQEDWLREVHPHAFREQDEVVYDPTLRKAVRWVRRCYHDLPLQEKLSEDVPEDKAAALLARQVLDGKCPLKEWNDEVDQWIVRLNWLSQACPEYELPPIGEAEKTSLIEQLCFGAAGYKDIKDKPVWPTLKSWLSPSQLSLLDQMAPERWPLPQAKGKGGKIRYSLDRPPVLSAKIQDLYGLSETPRLAGGKVPVILEILGPNFRPLQNTGDLASFWKTTYPQLKPELQRRYPKHLWK